MTICPRHRDLFGLRWQSGRSICTIPDEVAAHKSSSAKGLCGLRSNQSAYVYFKTQQLVPTGSRKSRGTKLPKTIGARAGGGAEGCSTPPSQKNWDNSDFLGNKRYLGKFLFTCFMDSYARTM